MPRPASSVLVPAALAVAFFWAVDGIDPNAPQIERMAILLTVMALAWLWLRGDKSVAGWTAYLAVLVAMSERLRRTPILEGSDVLRATSESLAIVANGGDPYVSFLHSTIPPGSPFVYPPGELAWYALPQWLLGDITRVDTWAGILIVVALALAGFRLGAGVVVLPAMLYATWGISAFRAADGSNDVSASALVVFALVALVFATGEGPWPRRALIASAVLFGWAIAFKQYSLLVLPPVARHLAVHGGPWRRYVAVALGVAAAFVLPFLLWDPGAFLHAQLEAVTFHDEIWGTNLLNTLAWLGDPHGLAPVFVLIETAGTLALVTLVAARWNAPTLGAAAFVGAGLVLVPLLFAKWTTQPYYVYVGALVACGLAFLDTRIGADG